MLSHISIEVLEQLKTHLTQLNQIEYSQKLLVFNNVSIGAHTRHVIEFYQCLLNGAKVGLIDYDARQRDLRIEQQLDYTLDMLDEIMYRLQTINDLDLKLSLRVQYGEESYIVPTSFEREEVYLVEHTIHHYALIRIGLQESFPHVEIDCNFGYAHSTIQHKKEKTVKLLENAQV